MKMPEKDPNVWSAIAGFIEAAQVFFYAAAVAAARILMDDKEKVWHRIGLEMVLCGLLAQGADELVKALTPWDIPVAVAAGVGLLGPTYLRLKLRRAIAKKVESEKE